jgi:GT2 family glycosyltransferase
MRIEFVIPTYERTDHLMTILSSLVAQTNPNWTAHVVIDKPFGEDVLEKLAKIAIYYENEGRIKFTLLDKHYGDWGHTPRNYGLKSCNQEWIVMTGEDNYYVPVFVDEMLKVTDDDTHFVFCDFVINGTDNEYLPVPSKIELGRIDIGCYMTRTFNSKKMELDVTRPDSDFSFVEEYLYRFHEGKIKKVEKILYVHN